MGHPWIWSLVSLKLFIGVCLSHISVYTNFHLSHDTSSLSWQPLRMSHEIRSLEKLSISKFFMSRNFTVFWSTTDGLVFSNFHAPLKMKCINKPQVPYMNSELRKTMNNRSMWRGKHFRNKKDKYARSMYVKWRNKVVRLRKISIQNYFDRRCNKKTQPEGLLQNGLSVSIRKTFIQQR